MIVVAREDSPLSVGTGASQDALLTWLSEEVTPYRWVALHDGEMAGLIMMVNPHAYLISFYNLLRLRTSSSNRLVEVLNFFRSPAAPRYGRG